MCRPATAPGAYPTDPLANDGLEGIGTVNKNKMHGVFARRGIGVAENGVKKYSEENDGPIEED